MNDTDLHDNDPFIDDEYTYHAPTPALPAYGDVLAALGNPGDPLAAIAGLKAQAEVGALLARIPGRWDVEIMVWDDRGGGIPYKTFITENKGMKRIASGGGATRADALRTAVAAMEADDVHH